jgi:hypothetical protein
VTGALRLGGTLISALVLVGLKTLIDLGLHLREHARALDAR